MKRLFFVLMFIMASVLYGQTTTSGLYDNTTPVSIKVDAQGRPLTAPMGTTDGGTTFIPIKLEADGATSVALQDQTTDPIVAYFNRLDGSTTLSDSTEIDEEFIVVTSVVGITVLNEVTIFNPDLLRFTQLGILSISNDTIYVDTPLDVEYPIGSFVDITTTEMSVDASVTPQIFGIRGVSPSPVGISVDITRIIFTIIMNTTPEFSDFGDIAGGLTHGLVLRKRNGRYFNVFNVKTNQELSALMYDLTVFEGAKTFNTNAMVGRLTFAGQSKVGVVIRLTPGEDLEFILHDDLSSLLSMKIVAEGHIVE